MNKAPLTSLQKYQQKEFQKHLRLVFQKSRQNCVHFSSFDPLDLLNHPYSKDLAIEYAIKWGAGLSLSRDNPLFEEKLKSTKASYSSLCGLETTFFMHYQDDFLSLLLSRIVTRKSLLIKERSIKSSPYFPLEMRQFSQSSPATLQDALDNTSSSSFDRIVIVFESFSLLDGVSQLDTLIEIGKAKNALIIVDDTNAFGLLGHHGYGLTCQKKGIDLVFSHMGKNFGYYATSLGVAPSMHDFFPSLLFFKQQEYALSPFLLGLIEAAIMLIPTLHDRRLQVEKMRDTLMQSLITLGFSPIKGPAYLLLPFLTQKQLKHFSHYLSEENFLIQSPSHTDLPYLYFRFSVSQKDTEMKRVEALVSSYKEMLFCEAL